MARSDALTLLQTNMALTYDVPPWNEVTFRVSGPKEKEEKASFSLTALSRRKRQISR